jgi:hypothetical protein
MTVSEVLAASIIREMRVSLIALMMGAARTSETLVNVYQTTRHYNPEDSHLRTHRRENLKSYFVDRCLGHAGLESAHHRHPPYLNILLSRQGWEVVRFGVYRY